MDLESRGIFPAWQWPLVVFHRHPCSTIRASASAPSRRLQDPLTATWPGSAGWRTQNQREQMVFLERTSQLAKCQR